jgi:hypothetical protein
MKIPNTRFPLDSFKTFDACVQSFRQNERKASNVLNVAPIDEVSIQRDSHSSQIRSVIDIPRSSITGVPEIESKCRRRTDLLFKEIGLVGGFTLLLFTILVVGPILVGIHTLGLAGFCLVVWCCIGWSAIALVVSWNAKSFIFILGEWGREFQLISKVRHNIRTNWFEHHAAG